MNANDPSDSRRSSRPEIIEKDLSALIIAAFYEVYNALGFGFLESIYARALEIALRRRGLFVEREVACEIYFMGEKVGVHRADILVERRIIIEVKASQVLADFSKRQLLNYVTAFGLRLGILLHFGPSPHSIVFSPHGKPNDEEQFAFIRVIRNQVFSDSPAT